MWCDANCQALNTSRVDVWSCVDVFILVIICVVMGAITLLVFAKYIKVYECASMWVNKPGAHSPESIKSVFLPEQSRRTHSLKEVPWANELTSTLPPICPDIESSKKRSGV